MLLDPERLERGLGVYLEAEKGEDGGPREGGRRLTNRIAEADKRATRS